MTFTSFASSSAGNLYLVEDGTTAVLLECGVTFKRVQKYLGFDFSKISGCLLSHEHKDHAKAASQLTKAGVPLYCSEGTAEALELTQSEIIRAGEQFVVGSLIILPFETFHDAAEPLGFLIYSRADGENLVFATDTVALRYRFPGLTTLAIEANFDSIVLSQCRKIPEKVQKRIQRTHMEIDTLCRYLRELDLTSCREVYLLHLSDSCAHEAEFCYKARRSVPPGVRVVACGKE